MKYLSDCPRCAGSFCAWLEGYTLNFKREPAIWTSVQEHAQTVREWHATRHSGSVWDFVRAKEAAS